MLSLWRASSYTYMSHFGVLRLARFPVVVRLRWCLGVLWGFPPWTMSNFLVLLWGGRNGVRFGFAAANFSHTLHVL